MKYRPLCVVKKNCLTHKRSACVCVEVLPNAFSQFRSERVRCGSYDCKTTSVEKTQDSWSKFMLNVKIQNKNKNVQTLNSLSGFSGVPCKNSTSDSGFNSYNSECNQFIHLTVQGDTELVATQVTTEFADEEVSDTSLMPTSQLWYSPTNTADSDLKDFLSRPVNIYNATWAVGGGVGTTFDPWSLYFKTANIQYKLHNYAFMRCDLKIKIMINASPFYYGAFLASYTPLETSLDSADHGAVGNVTVPLSQRPCTWIYPQTNQGSEMCLPYLNITEWLPIHGTIGTTDVAQMGRITFTTVKALANVGVTSSDVSLHVYAWAENVELCGLTVDLAVQGSDEYTGPVSKVASAIARGSGLLSSVPVVGKYMTATSMASQTVADIAASFGFTKVPVLERILPFKNLPFHGLATSDQPDVTEKLSLDSKNELTIDNRVIGDPDKDILLLSNFCGRKSYLTQFTWTAASSTNALLWNTYVSPAAFIRTAGTSQYFINGTPMFLATRMFEFWRGDIIYDFKIICSKYHKGRLRFSWDPVGDVANQPSNTQSVFNHIQDISETTEISLRVPYAQRTSYMKTPSSLSTTYFNTTALAADTSDTINGILTVRVMSEQTSPVTSADITILVFVRAADNIEFACPKEIDTDLNFYTVQGDVSDVVNVVMGAPSNVDKNVNLVYMGESIISLRELLQRCNHHMSWNDVIPTSQSEFHSNFMSRRPLYRGFDTNGVHTATAPVLTTTQPFNFVTNTPYHLISSCFLGERGSFTWKMNADTKQFKSISASRSRQILTAAKYNPSGSGNVFNMNVNASIAADAMATRRSTCYGTSLMNQKTNTGVSVNVPMYSIFTMLDTSPASRTLGNLYTKTATDTITFNWVTHEESDHAEVDYDFHDFYFQVGPDYSLVFFLNVPVIYEYASPVAV